MKNWRIPLLGATLFASTAFAAPQEVDKVAAIVNNDVVLQSDIDDLFDSIKKQSQRAKQLSLDETALRHQILNNLIMDQIQLQIATRKGIVLTDQGIDKVIISIAQHNNISTDQLRSRLERDGISYNTYRTQIRKEMIINRIRNSEVRRRVTILPQEVDQLAKQVAAQRSRSAEFNISQILLPLSESPTQDQVDSAGQLVKKIVSDLKNSADFDKLKIIYSASPQVLKSSDMGWSKLQELPSLFAQVLSTAQKGQVIGPIRSGIGFHILKVNDVHGGNKAFFVTEVRARHILLKPSVIMTDAQANAKLKQVSVAIKTGEAPFADKAKEISQDPSSASHGGDLGWNPPKIYDPVFRDALMNLKKGEMSAPVHSSFGWHLIQLTDIRQVDKKDAAQKERAYRILFNRKFAKEAQMWMQEQRAEAYVKITDSNGRIVFP